MKKNKVVINIDFGGFNLSDAACARLLELGSTHVRATTPEEQGDSVFGRKYLGFEDIPRHDPLLIQVVEELGVKASDDYSSLAVVTIDGNKYSIWEYDGAEKVDTPGEQTWIEIPE